VSENDTLKRRDLLKLVAGGALGAAAGMAGCRSAGITSARAVPAGGVRASYDWTLEIRGGYGWLFKKDATVKVMSIKKTSCDALDHPMLLIVAEGDGLVDPATTYKPNETDGMMSWSLDGDTRFISGLPTLGLTQGPRRTWTELKDPYSPKDLESDAAWDDQVWLTERVKARSDAESRASRSLLVPYGRLSVGRPQSEWGRKCRWAFTDGKNQVRRKALTDRLLVSARLDEPIGLQTAKGNIYLRPADGLLSMIVQSSLDLEHQTFKVGDKLPHIAMLYDFADGTDCAKAVVPAIEARPDVPFPVPVVGAPFSPGDLCPPLMLDEEV
jgi:hypothetical protein